MIPSFSRHAVEATHTLVQRQRRTVSLRTAAQASEELSPARWVFALSLVCLCFWFSWRLISWQIDSRAAVNFFVHLLLLQLVDLIINQLLISMC